jgi:DHA1 family tetracycline resistance protein-like MFS transporter
MVSGRAGPDNQGEMQGLLTAVEGLTAVAAPLATAGLFFLFTSKLLPVTFPGAPFALAAAAAMTAYVLIRRI